ncbi:unnamed protein product [Darwinula stevensoni]|uniref:Ig-like domain-containing protein n=1 Tax=Darwinula stevensoni TaxID=69355 RepID=A0A7R8XAP3_9CRUS|nr:unnamed protein product [Darwinula stevensoni]CAG0885756.1 unnamed protein product [Darwinula stevensoni]
MHMEGKQHGFSREALQSDITRALKDVEDDTELFKRLLSSYPARIKALRDRARRTWHFDPSQTIMNQNSSPYFGEPAGNVTAVLGRNTTLTCKVKDLGSYKVAWAHMDRKMVLVVDDRVATRIPRFGLSFDSDRITWRLHITGVTKDDAGRYMCQLNTEPMQALAIYLRVVVPPEIDDDKTSRSTVSVPENTNVTLMCHAHGNPTPTIYWRREDDRSIRGHSPQHGENQTQGRHLVLVKVNRNDMGAYLCIANNGIPPTVSKRISLEVEFQPSIRVEWSLIHAPRNSDVTLRCSSESHPRPLHYWLFNQTPVLNNVLKYETKEEHHSYTTFLDLTVKNIQPQDYEPQFTSSETASSTTAKRIPEDVRSASGKSTVVPCRKERKERGD